MCIRDRVDGQARDGRLGEFPRSKTWRRHYATIVGVLLSQLATSLRCGGDRFEEGRAHGPVLEDPQAGGRGSPRRRDLGPQFFGPVSYTHLPGPGPRVSVVGAA